MSKKKNLFKTFTQDISYNYHIVKTEEPIGHLIYLMKSDSELNTDSLEFSPTIIVEELVKDCGVKIEKFAPSIFFTEEDNTSKLKYELGEKLTENTEFSEFIETIKDEYRILEVKDSLLYKKDPEAYNEAKQKEHEEHQKELWDEMIKQHEDKVKKRENALLEYNNNLIKLLQDHLKGIVEYEKTDFDLDKEIEKVISNLIDSESWIKIDDKPFICRVEVLSLKQDTLGVFLTDNNENTYIADLRFNKTVLVTENVKKIDSKNLPISMKDYEFLSQLFDVDTNSVEEWNYKNDSERFEYIINYLVPIFKKERLEKEQDFISKLKEKMDKKSENVEDLDINEDEEYEDEDEDEIEMNNSRKSKSSDPKKWYFDVFVPEDIDDLNPASICLSEDGGKYLDDQLGSHNLPQNIIDSLNRAGIYGDGELMEAIWEVVDSTTKTKEDIINSMEKEGFVYLPGMLD